MRSVGLNGGKAERVLEEISIAVNKNTCPGDKSAMNPSGIRIGSPALTSRDFKEKDFLRVADFIDQGLNLQAYKLCFYFRIYQISLVLGFKLAVEINKAASSPALKDFKEKMAAPEFKQKLHDLKQSVEEFAAQFPMPGLEEY